MVYFTDKAKTTPHLSKSRTAYLREELVKRCSHNQAAVITWQKVLQKHMSNLVPESSYKLNIKAIITYMSYISENTDEHMEQDILRRGEDKLKSDVRTTLNEGDIFDLGKEPKSMDEKQNIKSRLLVPPYIPHNAFHDNGL